MCFIYVWLFNVHYHVQLNTPRRSTSHCQQPTKTIYTFLNTTVQLWCKRHNNKLLLYQLLQYHYYTQCLLNCWFLRDGSSSSFCIWKSLTTARTGLHSSHHVTQSMVSKHWTGSINITGKQHNRHNYGAYKIQKYMTFSAIIAASSKTTILIKNTCISKVHKEKFKKEI